MSQTVRAVLFAIAVALFVAAAIFPDRRLIPAGLAFGFGVFMLDAIDAA